MGVSSFLAGAGLLLWRWNSNSVTSVSAGGFFLEHIDAMGNGCLIMSKARVKRSSMVR